MQRLAGWQLCDVRCLTPETALRPLVPFAVVLSAALSLRARGWSSNRVRPASIIGTSVRLGVWRFGSHVVVCAPCKRGVGILTVAGFDIVSRSAQDVRPWGVWLSEIWLILFHWLSPTFAMPLQVSGLSVSHAAPATFTDTQEAKMMSLAAVNHQQPSANSSNNTRAGCMSPTGISGISMRDSKRCGPHERCSLQIYTSTVNVQSELLRLELLAKGHGYSNLSGSFAVNLC